MKILLHDYSGHPFQAQLSRELARRGHTVTHVFSADFQTPKGRLTIAPGDPAGLSMRPLTLNQPFQKDSFVKRRFQEERFGRLVAEEIARVAPDVVISSNAPLDAQKSIAPAARRAGAAFVFWVQDVYSEAIRRILGRRYGMPGEAAGAWYRRLEASLLRGSDAVVAITADFTPILSGFGVASGAIDVIENWAPLDDLAYEPLAGRTAHARPRFIYAGTLGLKHNPDLLLRIAAELPIDLRVYSEGRVADDLRIRAAERGVQNLTVSPWLPFDRLGGALADGDVLIAVIEPDAGIFSVPSKALTYLAAGRAILASIPLDNLAARIISREGAGLVAAPDDGDGFLAHARALANDAGLRARMGGAGRAYAERTFDITAVGDRFEAILTRIAPAERAPRAAHG